MVNRLCTLDPYAEIRKDFGKITTGFDRTAAELDSHQAQISKEVQDRAAAVQGHISAIAAHAAAAITLSPVTGLNANNLQTAVEQLRTMLTTIIAGPAPSAAEIQAARVGADNIARNSLDILIKEIHAQQLAANTATAQLKHGQNVINASEAGPVAVTIKGNTLVNLIPNGYGNFEIDSNGDGVADGWQPINQGTKTLEATTAKYGLKAQRIAALSSDTIIQRGIYTAGTHTIQSGKYYLLMVDVLKSSASAKAKIVLFNYASTITSLAEKSDTTMLEGLMYLKYSSSVDSTTIRVNMYNESPVGSTDWVQFDGVRLYEVDSATYAKIDVEPEFTGGRLAERYPYVDGVKHATNPVITKVGKNIFDIDRPFALAGTAGTSAVVESPTSLLITSSTSTYNHAKHETYPVLPNTTYTLSYKAVNISGVDAPAASVRKGSDLTQLTVREVAGDIVMSFNTGPETSIALYFYGSRATASVQQKRYENIQLEIGAVATLYEPHNDDYCYAVTTLAGYGGVNDVLTIRGAGATVLRRWRTDVDLSGSRNWKLFMDAAYSGYKRLTANVAPANEATAGGSRSIIVKPNGLLVEAFASSPTKPDQGSLLNSSGDIYLSVSNTESGWGEDFNPSTAEIKAYFWGWKMNKGTFGQPYNGSGTKTWTRCDAASNTGAVTTVPTAMADGYTPYKLSYQLATPITEVVPVEGSLANHAGVNLYEVSEGVIVREKVTPKFDTGRYYIIGNAKNREQSSYWGGAITALAAVKLLQVQKNSIKDLKWILTTTNNAYVDPSFFEASAEYTITYLAADKYALTAPVVDGALDYQASAKSVQQALVQRTADAETAITIHDLILAQHTARLLALEA